MQIDGRLTLGENIADNGGVRTAFRAFRNVMNGTTDEQQLIDGHTADQLFFVAFAQVYSHCNRERFIQLILLYSYGVQRPVMII